MFSQENMTASSVPTTSVPTLGRHPASGLIKVYPPDTSKQWRLGGMAIGFGLLGAFLPLRAIFHWLSGAGPMPEGGTFMAAGCLLFVPAGFLLCLSAMRGLPRVTVMPQGIKHDLILRKTWAAWDSLEPFVVTTRHVGRFNKEVRTGSAQIIGNHVSKNLLGKKRFVLPDSFQQPIAAVVAEINATRAQATGIAAPPPGVTAVPQEAAVGLAEFKLPWVTLALLGVLIFIFIFENTYGLTPSVALKPSLATLLGMGALNRTAVLVNGEWYRLFTAPLLHANLAHIAGNGVALLLGGWLLERLVGRLWFFAFFAVGALGGSLMSLAIGPPNLVSVGASGALMGLFSALFVSSFRLASGTSARTRLQMNSMRVLIPSLLPLFSTSTVHIDYGAHFGGAIAGALLAAPLLKFWPQSERLPQLRNAAAAISAAGGALFITSIAAAIANYPNYDVTLIPQAEVPHTAADMQARAATLVARYPNDPRSHLYLGQALAAAKDNAGAERELRVALADAQKYSPLFGSQLELALRGVLSVFLAEQGRKDEARDIAHPLCAAPTIDKSLDDLMKALAVRHMCD